MHHRVGTSLLSLPRAIFAVDGGRWLSVYLPSPLSYTLYTSYPTPHLPTRPVVVPATFTTSPSPLPSDIPSPCFVDSVVWLTLAWVPAIPH